LADYFGLWLSLVERLVRDQEAVGSNPTSPIDYLLIRYGRAVAARRQAVGSNPTTPIELRFYKYGYAAGVAVLVSGTEIKYKGVWHKRLYTRESF
jgi:hypothetical protein